MIEKIKCVISLVTEEPFRIGGKQDPLSGQENPVTIVGDEIVIPGPSLKGALRASIETFLIDRYYNKESNTWNSNKLHIKPCIPSPEKQLSEDEKRLAREGKYRRFGCHYPCDPKPNRCNKENHSICPVCYLLGANGLNGFVRIPFLKADIPSSSVNSLYSARLDRATSTVMQGTNRPYSLVPQNTTFTGVIEIIKKDDILNWELGKKRILSATSSGDKWLDEDNWDMDRIISELIIDRLTGIRKLGGYKSKGCGIVKINAKCIRVPDGG